MRVAADVKNHQGMVLLSKGSVVKKTHIKTFNMWGVVEIEVEDFPGDKAGKRETIDESAYDEEVIAEAKKRFKLTNFDHPAIVEIYNLCIERMMEEKEKEGHYG